jgi:hypothetical protein
VLEKGRGLSGKKVRGHWRNGMVLRGKNYKGAGERAWSFGEESKRALEKGCGPSGSKVRGRWRKGVVLLGRK